MQGCILCKDVSYYRAIFPHYNNVFFRSIVNNGPYLFVFALIENGPDPISNSKLDGIISRAKAVKMPKDSIESAIKSGLRVSDISILPRVMPRWGWTFPFFPDSCQDGGVGVLHPPTFE